MIQCTKKSLAGWNPNSSFCVSLSPPTGSFFFCLSSASLHVLVCRSRALPRPHASSLSAFSPPTSVFHALLSQDFIRWDVLSRSMALARPDLHFIKKTLQCHQHCPPSLCPCLSATTTAVEGAATKIPSMQKQARETLLWWMMLKKMDV